MAEVEPSFVPSLLIVAIVGISIAPIATSEGKRSLMRIRVVQRPSRASVDGMRLDPFEPGYVYDVGTTLGMLFLAEGWAEPVVTEEPAFVVPLSETKPSAA